MNLEVTKTQRGRVVSVWLTERQAKKLDRIRQRTGLSASQLIRALVDQIEEIKAIGSDEVEGE